MLSTTQHLLWSSVMGKRKLLFSHCNNYERQKYDCKRQLYNSLVKGSISLPLGWTNLNRGDSTVQIRHKCNHRMFGSDTLSAGFLWPDVAIMHPRTPSDKKRLLPLITSSKVVQCSPPSLTYLKPAGFANETLTINWFPCRKKDREYSKIHLAAAL